MKGKPMYRPEIHFHDHGGGGSEPVLSLAAQLHSARAELQQLQPPTQVLPELLAAFDRLHAHVPVRATALQRLHHGLAQWLASGGVGGAGPSHGRARWATACVLAVTVGLIVLMQPPLPTHADDPARAPVAAQASFLPLVPPGKMAGSPAAWLVPAELSHANLASLGAPFDPSRAGETVHAELLVNARGDVLAVRFP
jgi:hypothetical protein